MSDKLAYIERKLGTDNLIKCPVCEEMAMTKSASNLDYGEYCYHCHMCDYFWKTDWDTPFGK